MDESIDSLSLTATKILFRVFYGLFQERGDGVTQMTMLRELLDKLPATDRDAMAQQCLAIVMGREMDLRRKAQNLAPSADERVIRDKSADAIVVFCELVSLITEKSGSIAISSCTEASAATRVANILATLALQKLKNPDRIKLDVARLEVLEKDLAASLAASAVTAK